MTHILTMELTTMDTTGHGGAMEDTLVTGDRDEDGGEVEDVGAEEEEDGVVVDSEEVEDVWAAEEWEEVEDVEVVVVDAVNKSHQ
jgi:hypothetical protein